MFSFVTRLGDDLGQISQSLDTAVTQLKGLEKRHVDREGDASTLALSHAIHDAENAFLQVEDMSSWRDGGGQIGARRATREKLIRFALTRIRQAMDSKNAVRQQRMRTAINEMLEASALEATRDTLGMSSVDEVEDVLSYMKADQKLAFMTTLFGLASTVSQMLDLVTDADNYMGKIISDTDMAVAMQSKSLDQLVKFTSTIGEDVKDLRGYKPFEEESAKPLFLHIHLSPVIMDGQVRMFVLSVAAAHREIASRTFSDEDLHAAATDYVRDHGMYDRVIQLALLDIQHTYDDFVAEHGSFGLEGGKKGKNKSVLGKKSRSRSRSRSHSRARVERIAEIAPVDQVHKRVRMQTRSSS